MLSLSAWWFFSCWQPLSGGRKEPIHRLSLFYIPQGLSRDFLLSALGVESDFERIPSDLMTVHKRSQRFLFLRVWAIWKSGVRKLEKPKGISNRRIRQETLSEANKAEDSWTYVCQDRKISGLEKDQLGQNFGWTSGSKGKRGNVKQKCYFSLMPRRIAENNQLRYAWGLSAHCWDDCLVSSSAGCGQVFGCRAFILGRI